MKILKGFKFEDYNDDLFDNNGKISFTTGTKISFPKNTKFIVPGFIDQHIHGANNSDTMDNTIDSIKNISTFLLSEGTTSYLPTTMTFDLKVVKEVIKKVNSYQLNQGENEAEILGIHLEGPFISKKYIGAQNPLYTKTPNIKEFDDINIDNIIKLVTYAPEEDLNLEFTKHLKSKGIIPSVGHSNATCKEVAEAITKGLSNFTHFHNASTPHHHREPGVVSAGFSNKEIMVELIVDGIHLHPDAIKTTYNIKGWENITLITDSMRAKGCPNGKYDLGGQTVIKKDYEARLESGSLAGSVLGMNKAISNFIEFTGCATEEAFLMASYNPAQHLGLDDRGIIEEDKILDITCLDENFNILKTYKKGKVGYRKGDENGN